MSWGRSTMILATFVQKCKEKCVWSPGLPLTVSKEGVQCTGLGNFTFQSSLLSTTLTTHSLWMNLNICIVQLIICWKIHIYYLRILTLGWNVLSLFGLVTVEVTRQKTNLFSSDIGSDDDDANPTNQSPVYRVQIHSLLYFIVYW